MQISSDDGAETWCLCKQQNFFFKCLIDGVFSSVDDIPVTDLVWHSRGNFFFFCSSRLTNRNRAWLMAVALKEFNGLKQEKLLQLNTVIKAVAVN